MNVTYVASDNTAGDAQALGASGEDIRVYQVIFGTPGDGEAIKLYNKATAFGHASGIGSTDSSNVALYFTQPSAGAGKPYVPVLDFGEKGLPLDGGSFHTDSSQVTVVWDRVDEV